MLITSLKDVKDSEVIRQNTEQVEDMKMILFSMERSLSFEECHNAEKIFQLRKEIGEDLILRLVVFVIASFQNSLKVANGLTSAEIINVADDFLNTYTHDSINDLIFALRKAKYDGKEFYNKFSHQDIQAILKKYFEEKAAWIEIEERVKPVSTLDTSIHKEVQALLRSGNKQEAYALLETTKTEDVPQQESYKIQMQREKARQMVKNTQKNRIITDEHYFAHLITEVVYTEVNQKV